ncbi:MAG: PIN domain-containing protein [Prevotella sp.]|nr:PIN domain-containing protein [Prevotella sp.]
MAVYLVDFENVSSAGISGIQKLTKEDKVYIFYTVNAANMSFAAHLNLLSSPAEVVYYNVASGGKNALDFQLASFLGYLICQGREKKFCIISNDRGFEYVKTFWERNGIAADISIFGSPSINRSLLAAEKPYTARIQQNAAAPAAQASAMPAAAVQIPAETAADNAADGEKSEAEVSETAAEARDVPEVTEAEQAAEKPAPKKRGRPRSVPKQEKRETVQEIKSEAETPAAEEPAEQPKQTKRTPRQPGRTRQSPKEPAPKQTAEESAPKPADVAGEIPAALKSSLSKAGIIDDAEIRNVLGLLKSSEGKQQFYRGILKFFGMERGVEVYKAVRPEYTNLTKLIKQ